MNMGIYLLPKLVIHLQLECHAKFRSHMSSFYFRIKILIKYLKYLH